MFHLSGFCFWGLVWVGSGLLSTLFTMAMLGFASKSATHVQIDSFIDSFFIPKTFWEQGQSWPYHYFDPVHFHTVWYNSFFHSCRPYLFIRSWLITVGWEVSWVVRSYVVVSTSTDCGKKSAGIGCSLGFTPGSFWGKGINCWYLFFGVYILRAMFFILSGSQ